MTFVSHPLVLTAILVGLVMVGWNFFEPIPNWGWATWAIGTCLTAVVAHHFEKPAMHQHHSPVSH